MLSANFTIAPGKSGSAPAGSPVSVVQLPNGTSLVSGTSAPGAIHIPAGKVTVHAGSANHTIYAGPGTDTITTGPGSDTVVLGSGTAVVFAADHTRDTITCGTGKATIYADKIDVLKSCKKATVYRR